MLLYMRRKNTTTEMMKSYIVEALFQLLKSKNFDTLSIRHITDRAGVNRSTYYRNFPSKVAIIYYFFEKLMIEYEEIYQNKNISTLDEYLLSIFECFYTYKNELIVLYKNDLTYPLLEVFHKYFKYENTDESIPLTEKYKIAYHVGGIYNHLLFWFYRDMKETPSEMAKLSLETLNNGFQPNLNKE